MPPLNVLIKPVSCTCNLKCSYCFYLDVSSNREIFNYGKMSTDTLEQLMKQIFDYAESECTIAWQGGEPTLAGLSFFRTYLRLEKKYNTRNIPVHRSIQTNGYLLNDEWASFLAENHFLVGISLDGTEITHNTFRKTPDNRGSFHAVCSAIQRLEAYHVDYNILTVVNRVTASQIESIYAFYKAQSFHYQQYIACLDALHESPGKHSWSLLPEEYGKFLIQLFQLWYRDALSGRAPYIRQFENYIGILLGYPPESCEQNGICGNQKVVEADGSVYPCDFYVTDEHCLGTIFQHTFSQLQASARQQAFLQRSYPIPSKCSTCPYLKLCRNGCSRHRHTPDGTNYFCQSYQMFFQECLPLLKDLARRISIEHSACEL